MDIKGGIATAYLIVVVAAPRVTVDVVPGYAVGIDDLAWLGLAALWRPSRPPLAMALALLAAALSILFRQVPEFAPSLLTFGRLVQAFAVFLIARSIGVTPAAMTRAAAYAVLALAAIASVELFTMRDAMTTGGWLPYRIFNNALYPGQTNHVAGFVALAMPLLLARSDADRMLRWTAAALGAGVVMLCASRTALAAMVAGLVVTMLSSRAAWVALALVVVGALWFGPMSRRLSWLDDEAYYLDYGLRRHVCGAPPTHTEGRFRMLTAWIALQEFRRAPVFGSGLGSRHRIFYESAPVMIVAETGLVGLAAALFLAWSLARGARGPTAAVFVAFLVLSLGMVTPVIARVVMPLWIVMGVYNPSTPMFTNSQQDR